MQGTAPWSRIAPALIGLGLLYLATQFARTALGVISDDIEEAFALHSTQTALLTGTMFLTYGLGQIPAAALLTRFGPRTVLPLAGALLAASFWVLAKAENFTTLLIARQAMGLGAAPVLAGSFAVFTGFGEARFTMLTGWQVAFGRAGVIVATTPLALLIAAVGWRDSFVWAAVATAAAAIAATAVLVSLPPPEKPASAPKGFAPMLALVASRDFRIAATFQGVSTAVGGTILGLWGGPWLSNIYDMDVKERGAMLLALAIANFASAPMWGYLASYGAIRQMVLAAAGASVLLLVVPAFVHLPPALILPWLVLVGLLTGFYPAVLDELRRGLPPGTIVYLSTLLSAGTMLVVFVVQLATGVLADLLPGRPGHHPEVTYVGIYLLMAAMLALTTLGYSRTTVPPRPAPKTGGDAGSGG